jgi:hypothetical protein
MSAPRNRRILATNKVERSKAGGLREEKRRLRGLAQRREPKMLSLR